MIGIVLAVRLDERCIPLFEILAELGNALPREYTKGSPLDGVKILLGVGSRRNSKRPIGCAYGWWPPAELLESRIPKSVDTG